MNYQRQGKPVYTAQRQPGCVNPDPETLAARQGYTLLRTGQNGWIEITTDGDAMWVEVERK